MHRSHKIQLDPNNRQETYFRKACGVARFAYNWGLAEWGHMYKAGESPSWMSLNRKLNSVKRTEFPWMLDVTKCAPLAALSNLGDAFQKFFTKKAKYPKFKKRGAHDSFYLANDKFSVKNKRIRIPKLGWVRLRESLRLRGKILSATVSRTAGRWFVAIVVEVPDKVSPTSGSVGIDLGLTAFATLSTGEKFLAPKPLKEGIKKLQTLSKSVSRKQLGSCNRAKAKTKLAVFYYHMSCIRKDFLHKLSSKIASKYRLVGMEDLAVANMVKNHKLARSISDAGWAEFGRQLDYKAEEVIVVGRYYPSSKLCSRCSYKLEELPLSVREWACPACHTIHDRDINAAKNIMTEAVRTAGLAGIACGDGSSGLPSRRGQTKLLSVKQELGKQSYKSGKFPVEKTGKRRVLKSCKMQT
jgi:putative transposase